MSLLEDLYHEGKLTRDQYETVIDESSEVLCLACAGSGKSRTLAFRIAKLIYEGAKPESIVAFTFTEKAAESIKRRVAEALEKCDLPIELVGAMYIGTIHSYCQFLLGAMNAKYRQYEVLDENRLKLFLLSRYRDLNLHALREEKNVGLFATITEVSRAWKIANDEMLDFDAIVGEDEILGNCLRAISARLDSDQYIDFSLMIRRAVDALESDNEDINNALSEAKHLMVDEYQDVNVSQERLINGLYHRMESLFVVGDDDQAIYGWRGADVKNIVEFEQRYPDCSTHTLSVNFRSTDNIVSASSDFIQLELSTERIGKNPEAHPSEGVRQFGNYWFGSRAEEANWVASRIQELIGTKYIESDGVERGLTYSDIAILMRSVHGRAQHHREFTDTLRGAGIPYIIEAEGSLFERDYGRVMRDSMELLRTPGVSRESGTAFFNAQVLPVFPNANLNSFLITLSNWNSQIHTPAGGARRKVYPQMLVHDLIAAFNVATTRFDNPDQVMRDLGVFSGIILDVEKVYVSIDSSFRYQMILNFLQHVAEGGYDTSQVELLSRSDAVTVSTVHKMKGLEFPVVFIVDVVNLRFPLRNSNYNGWLPPNLMQNALSRGLYAGNNSGEARLFYTALTRAERFLYVTGSADHNQATLKRPSRYKLQLTNLGREDIVTDPTILPENMEPAPRRPRIDDESMPTSFTEIKDYLECPMKYKFRKIYGFSPAVPELFGFGLTTHTSIGRLHQLFTDNPPTQREAEQVAEEVFHLKHVFPARANDAEGPYERAREASKRLVGKYANDYPADFTQTRSLEQRFEIKADKALITGSIDLLLREDHQGNILEAKVIDFKSMDRPDDLNNTPFFWINLALQVQLYAHAADVVLGENAKTGAVHLLKADNPDDLPNRVDIPIDEESVNAAVSNVKWAVDRILEGEFPMRPSREKCLECDFNKICSRTREEFTSAEIPPHISIPECNGVTQVRVRCFSSVE